MSNNDLENVLIKALEVLNQFKKKNLKPFKGPKIYSNYEYSNDDIKLVFSTNAKYEIDWHRFTLLDKNKNEIVSVWAGDSTNDLKFYKDEKYINSKESIDLIFNNLNVQTIFSQLNTEIVNHFDNEKELKEKETILFSKQLRTSIEKLDDDIRPRVGDKCSYDYLKAEKQASTILHKFDHQDLSWLKDITEEENKNAKDQNYSYSHVYEYSCDTVKIKIMMDSTNKITNHLFTILDKDKNEVISLHLSESGEMKRNKNITFIRDDKYILNPDDRNVIFNLINVHEALDRFDHEVTNSFIDLRNKKQDELRNKIKDSITGMRENSQPDSKLIKP